MWPGQVVLTSGPLPERVRGPLEACYLDDAGYPRPWRAVLGGPGPRGAGVAWGLSLEIRRSVAEVTEEELHRKARRAGGAAREVADRRPGLQRVQLERTSW